MMILKVKSKTFAVKSMNLTKIEFVMKKKKMKGQERTTK